MALLACWPVLTSHAAMQQLGIIHEAHVNHHGEPGSHEHNSDNHVFADGDYVAGSDSITAARTPSGGGQVFLLSFATALSLCAVAWRHGTGTSPPPEAGPRGLSKAWQFAFRTALPARAPSPLS
ncbi:MAG TPA: hypothetical protein DCY13_05885 [Verrucomicrobiales bacterium]|nr:hypothetical protein [Verrucomicrobiales bacterium]